MATKADHDRIAAKRAQAAETIKRIAPHADLMLGMLDETKLDMLLLALNIGHVALNKYTET